jgi:hypothetical protein
MVFVLGCETCGKHAATTRATGEGSAAYTQSREKEGELTQFLVLFLKSFVAHDRRLNSGVESEAPPLPPTIISIMYPTVLRPGSSCNKKALVGIA